jgi:REP element-mobilizing transposase RayT
MRRPLLERAEWHVTARGARRLLLFHDDADYKAFYALLAEACGHTGITLIADCLMSNHFHLCLSGGTRSLGSCMQRLNRGYSAYHNERYGLSGHAFDRVYYGEPIPSAFLFQRVVRYIHLNPVRGGRVDHPDLYPWSNYRRLMTVPADSLTKGELQLLAAFDPDLLNSRRKYRDFLRKDLGRPLSPPAGRGSAWEIWQEQFRWILEFLMDQESVLGPLEPEIVAVYFGSRIGIPPRAMARLLNHPDGRRVSEMLQNFRRRLERNPALAGRLDALGIL